MVVRELVHDECQIDANGFTVGASSGAVVGEADAVIRHAGLNRVPRGAFLRLVDEVAERRQRRQLSVSE